MLRATILVSLVLIGAPACLADNTNFLKETSNIGDDMGSVVRQDRMMEIGSQTADKYYLQGDSALRTGNIERALKLLQKAVETEPDNLDMRVTYAGALEKKLRKQKDRDPKLYNFCVKQWLYVAKKTTYRDQNLEAAEHLKNLTGVQLHRFEPSKMFLSKVLIPEDGSTRVAFGKRIKAQ